MIDKILWKIIGAFILRQIEKFKDQLDWSKVKADGEARIRATVPGTWFDDEAVAAFMYLVGAAERALSDQAAFADILAKLAAGDYSGALDTLKDLILGALVGDSGTPAKVTSMLA